MGRPKALVEGPDGAPWVASAVRTLLDGGCDDVTVVLGAAASEARHLVPDAAHVVVAPDWAVGMSASLRAGLSSLVVDDDATAVLVHLVDLPDVGADVVQRVLGLGAGPSVLARAAYGGRPGHPVLLGRDHWAGVLAEAQGDAGARAFLRAHDVVLVECDDLADGVDVDRPPHSAT
jgi:molybdenum cofactor cytidylyltransferase/nicotine blue oxidoreductase